MVGTSASFIRSYVTSAEETVTWNMPLNKDPVSGIHASLPHHRLDVPLLAIPLCFLNMKKRISAFILLSKSSFFSCRRSVHKSVHY